MKPLPFPLICLLAVSVVGLTSCNKPSPLFNGKDFEGFVFDHDEEVDPATVWSVEDGVILCKGVPNGVLRTAAEYADYELSFAWRWAPGSEGGNSGLLLHSSTPRHRKIWPKCLEVQLQAGKAGDFILLGETIEVENQGNRQTDIRIARTGGEIEKPIGEWNTMKVRAEGDKVSVEINGELVNEGGEASATKGAICWQSEGAEIHFRDIVLTPLR